MNRFQIKHFDIEAVYLGQNENKRQLLRARLVSSHGASVDKFFLTLHLQITSTIT